MPSPVNPSRWPGARSEGSFADRVRPRSLVGCSVRANRHGCLAFRLYFHGLESHEGTKLKEETKLASISRADTIRYLLQTAVRPPARRAKS